MADEKRHLAGKVAWVTGSSRGIGQVLADHLASCGADVAVHGTTPYSTRQLHEADSLQAVADGIDTLHFEEVRRHVSTDAAHAYGGFLATLTAWCEHQRIPYQGVPVGTIKKHATGKGNANKAAVIAAARACR